MRGLKSSAHHRHQGRGDQIVVRGGRNSLNVDVTYEVDIEIPLLQTEIYRKNFTHTAKYPR